MKLSHVAILLSICAVLASLAVWAMPSAEPRFGVSFSTKFAWELGLDVDEAFWEIVNNLNVRAIRLPMYWDDIQPEFETWNWWPYDHLVQMADEKGVALTLAIGMKTPRWPECHIPKWAQAISSDTGFERVRNAYIEAVIRRYDGHPSIERYQIENEPLFPFGDCPPPDLRGLEREIATVRALTDKPIQTTVSGEFEPWSRAAPLVDVLGVSMYRISWNDLYGYSRYPIPAVFYKLRALATSRHVQRIVISELQAEPWFLGPPTADDARWARAFTKEDLADQVRFARRTGLPEAYLWGVEWWYYLRGQGYPELWEAGRELFRR